MKLQEEVLERTMQVQAAYDNNGFTGNDWNALSNCEAKVFAIQPERLAAMVVAWDCFLAFLGLQHPPGYSNRALFEARAALPRIHAGPVDLEPFMEFAATVCGLTKREAHAIYAKMDFWQVRSGIIYYSDEPKA